MTGTPSEETYQQDAYVIKNGAPYTGVNVTVYESKVSPYTWSVKYLKLTDGRGMISFLASEGYYYRFRTIDTGELDTIRASSASHAAFYMSITTSLINYTYAVGVNASSNTSSVTITFSSPSGIANFVNVTVMNSTTGQIVATGSYSSTDVFTSTLNTGHSNWTYIVKTEVYYPGYDVIEKTDIVAPEGVIFDIGSSLIPYLDMYQRNGLFLILLMVISGLFSWAQAHRGALIVVAVALMFRMTGLITVRYEIIMLAAGFAILASFIRGSRA
jgi:hypothetical protein